MTTLKNKCIFFIYDAVLTIIVLIFLLFVPFGFLFSRNWRSGFFQRIGIWSGKFRKKLDAKPKLWLHAASAGEINAFSAITGELKKIFSEHQIVVSTITSAGQEMSRKVMPPEIITFYLPIDLPWIINAVVRRLKPDLLACAETEIWPNLLKSVKKYGGKTILINGRFSDRSIKRYKLVKFLTLETLKLFDLCSMQSNIDRQKAIELGADPGKVVVVGDVKFDVTALRAIDPVFWRKELRIKTGQIVVVAGSTHEGEEEMILCAWEKVLEHYPDAVLILAPRHLTRLAKVIEAVGRHNFIYVRRSTIAEAGKAPNLIVMDTMGELASVYSIADLAFVGGSLVNVGGHNVLEPAAMAKPVLFGPHMENFRESVRLLKESGAGIEVHDAGDLSRQIILLLKFPKELSEIGKAGQKVVATGSGGTKRNLEIIRSMLDA